MQFLQGLMLGVAIGSGVAAVLGIHSAIALPIAVAAVACAGLIAVVTFRRESGRSGAPRGDQLVKDQPTPDGFFTGRELGDALTWIAQTHGVTTLEQVGVVEDEVSVLAVGPRGPVVASVTRATAGGYTAAVEDRTAVTGAGLDISGRFQARDLAPDVLPRVLDRARREHVGSWTSAAVLEAVIDRPDRLRDDVTVRLQDHAPDGSDDVVWASAAGDLLYVQGWPA